MEPGRPRGEGRRWREGTAPAEAAINPWLPSPRPPSPPHPASRSPLLPTAPGEPWEPETFPGRGKVPLRVTPSSCVGTMGRQMAGRGGRPCTGPSSEPNLLLPEQNRGTLRVWPWGRAGSGENGILRERSERLCLPLTAHHPANTQNRGASPSSLQCSAPLPSLPGPPRVVTPSAPSPSSPCPCFSSELTP